MLYGDSNVKYKSFTCEKIEIQKVLSSCLALCHHHSFGGDVEAASTTSRHSPRLKQNPTTTQGILDLISRTPHPTIRADTTAGFEFHHCSFKYSADNCKAASSPTSAAHRHFLLNPVSGTYPSLSQVASTSRASDLWKLSNLDAIELANCLCESSRFPTIHLLARN